MPLPVTTPRLSSGSSPRAPNAHRNSTLDSLFSNPVGEAPKRVATTAEKRVTTQVDRL